MGQTRIPGTTILDGSIKDVDIAPDAGIQWSKISKSGSSPSDIGAAPSHNPVFTGSVSVPTPIFGYQAATKGYVDTKIIEVTGRQRFVVISIADTPYTPIEVGDTYIVSRTSTYPDWAGYGDQTAEYTAQGWSFTQPITGYATAWSTLDKTEYVYSGSDGWIPVGVHPNVYVPYTGATSDVDLGTHALSSGTLNLATTTQYNSNSPTTNPSLEDGGDAGVLSGKYYYTVTFVGYNGVESTYPILLMPPSITVTNRKVRVYNIPTTTNPNIQHVRIYRTASNATYYRLQYLVQLPIGTTEYIDNVSDASLGTFVPNQDWLSGGVFTGGQKSFAVSLNAVSIGVNAGGLGPGVAIGSHAGESITYGHANVLIGAYSGYKITTSSGNVAVGDATLVSNIQGSENTVAGVNSGWKLTGSYNTLYGGWSGFDLTSGTHNTIIGHDCGYGLSTGSYNTIIGSNLSGLPANMNNNIILADGAGNIRLQVDASGNSTFNGTVTASGGFVGNLSGTASGNIPYVTPGASGNVLTSDGSAWISSPPSGGGGSVSAPLTLISTAASMVPLTVKGASGQTSDLLQWQNSVGKVIAKFDNNANLSIGTGSSIGALTFVGTGLNDAKLGGTYTGAFDQTLRIKITTVGAPDRFDWSIDGGATWAGTSIGITSGEISLSGTGVTVTFGATTGHTLGDYWQATLTAPVGYSNASNSLNVGGSPVVRAFGTFNTAVGIGAMGGGKNTGNNNTANGYQALYSNTTGYYNTANGMYALSSNTTGYNNTANGYQALYRNTTGNGNVANGSYTLCYNTTGYNNIANGYQALYNNTTAYGNTANGSQALCYNTTGNNNTATGMTALYKNTTGDDNTASGAYALFYNTTGANNTATGYQALQNNTTGSNNVADGMYALFYNTTGSNNTADGYLALYDLGGAQTAGSFHVGTSYTIKTLGTTDFTLIGASSNTVGVTFTATGPGTGTGTATPNNTSNNTAVGYNTGKGIIYGTGNTILGANVAMLPAGLTNNIILANGTGAIKAQHDGNNWTLTGNVGIGTTAPGELLSLGLAGTTKGVLSLSGDTSGKITIQPASASGTYTLTLPTALGPAGSVLTDVEGDGVLSWAPAGSPQTPWTSDIDAAGFTLYGNSTASGNLTLDSTSNVTKGYVLINPSGGNVGIGVAAPAANLHVQPSTSETKGIIVQGTSTPSDLAIGLAGYWKLDESTGPTASDSSGNGNTGTWQTTPVWTAGKIGNAASFSGTGTINITIPNSSSLAQVNSTKVSVSVWMYTTSNTAQRVISKDANTYYLYYDGTKIHWAINDVGYNDAGYAVSTNAWHHIVGTYDGSNRRLYVDGVLRLTIAQSTTMNNSGNLYIGAYGSYQPFQGMIDEAGVWNRVLSDTEVTMLYNSGAGNQSFVDGTQIANLQEWQSNTGYVFSSVSNVGAFKMPANGLTVGTDQLVASNGNIGIGTTMPAAKIEVDTSSASTVGAIIKGSSGQTADLLQVRDSTGAVKASVSATGNVTATQYRLSALNIAPANATDTGTTGEIRITAGYIYVCVATNTWVRAALTTW